MTISARGGYPTVENKIEYVVAFNELQHQLYNQMLHCQTNDEWYNAEELLENLRKDTRKRQESLATSAGLRKLRSDH